MVGKGRVKLGGVGIPANSSILPSGGFTLRLLLTELVAQSTAFSKYHSTKYHFKQNFTQFFI